MDTMQEKLDTVLDKLDTVLDKSDAAHDKLDKLDVMFNGLYAIWRKLDIPQFDPPSIKRIPQNWIFQN